MAFFLSQKAYCCSDENGIRAQSFFFGLIKTFKHKSQYDKYTKKTVILFGFQIYSRVTDHKGLHYYIANKKIHELLWTELIEKEEAKYIPSGHDHIYIIRSNLGEAFLFLRYCYESVLKNNKSRKPLIIITQKYHEHLINMLSINTPYLYIPRKHFSKISNKKFVTRKCMYFLYFTDEHFNTVEKNAMNMKLHYFDALVKYAGIDLSNSKEKKITISNKKLRSQLMKTKSINLNIEKFIFICPEASSCSMIKMDFWRDIAIKYKSLGYDIFINSKNTNSDIEAMPCKNCYLDIEEAYLLAQKSKLIISLRSGFTEALMTLQKKMIVLYTSFVDKNGTSGLSAQAVFDGFSLSKLPDFHANRVQEFIVTEGNESSISEKIITEAR